MTVSSTYSYQLTRDQLATASLRKLGVLAAGQTPTTQNISDAVMAMNISIAELRGIGMPLWAIATYSWIPTTNLYTIGTGQTLNVPYPIRMLQAYRQDSSLAKIPIEIEAAETFNILPDTPGGAPIKLNYKPSINYGTIRLWPIPESTNTTTVYIVYQRPFEYFNAATDTMSLPEEWYNALIYKVAVLLAPEWGVPLQDRQVLMKEADMYLGNAMLSGQEDGSFFIYPERTR